MTGQRKEYLFYISIIFMSVALFFNKVTGTEWITGMGALYGLFVAGNAVEHMANGKKKK